MSININEFDDESKEKECIPIENDDLLAVQNPWRRNFARALDIAVYSIIWTAFSHLILRWNPQASFMGNLIDTYCACGIMLLIEPLLLSSLGTTLGKSVLGLSIRDVNGRKLTFGQAFQRTWGVFGKGMGYNIPIYNIVREVKSYNACKNLETMVWDEGIIYRVKDKKIIRIFVYITLTITALVLSVLILLQAQMPIHRGNITPKQYYENCNDFLSYSGINYGKHLNNEGDWVDNASSGVGNIVINQQMLAKNKLTVSKGCVIGVKIEVETKTGEWITGYSNQKYMAIISFLAAQKKMNCINLYRSSILKRINNEFQNYSFVKAGVRVTNKVEYSGYEAINNHYLISTKGQPSYFHMIFTMEKVTPAEKFH